MRRILSWWIFSTKDVVVRGDFPGGIFVVGEKGGR